MNKFFRSSAMACSFFSFCFSASAATKELSPDASSLLLNVFDNCYRELAQAMEGANQIGKVVQSAEETARNTYTTITVIETWHRYPFPSALHPVKKATLKITEVRVTRDNGPTDAPPQITTSCDLVR